jgi:hypothetical protein
MDEEKPMKFTCYSGGKKVKVITVKKDQKSLYSSLATFATKGIDNRVGVSKSTGFNIMDKDEKVIFGWRGDFSVEA